MVNRKIQKMLLDWYRENVRELPWRANRDPYRIWISETMLQQTTTTAVIPFFERFLDQFPSLDSLANAKQEHVVEAWAGLGYYSRARNLHKAAQRLHQNGGFPRTHEELSDYPGFGPYTARSVASLAFDQEVGVVDGNVIRVLARFAAKDWDWWQGKTRKEIQTAADCWVTGFSSYEMNQALMELGRTLCTPKSPRCAMCPLRNACQSLKRDEVDLRPRPKPRRARELWLWEPQVTIDKNKILIRKNVEVPFLRDQWLIPGQARQVRSKPKHYDYRHSITHHDIYVTLMPPVLKINAQDKWIRLQEIRQYVPASLVQKALERFAVHHDGDDRDDCDDRNDSRQLQTTTAKKSRSPSRSKTRSKRSANHS